VKVQTQNKKESLTNMFLKIVRFFSEWRGNWIKQETKRKAQWEN